MCAFSNAKVIATHLALHRPASLKVVWNHMCLRFPSKGKINQANHLKKGQGLKSYSFCNAFTSFWWLLRAFPLAFPQWPGVVPQGKCIATRHKIPLTRFLTLHLSWPQHLLMSARHDSALLLIHKGALGVVLYRSSHRYSRYTPLP